jgi:hypothetical protein
VYVFVSDNTIIPDRGHDLLHILASLFVSARVESSRLPQTIFSTDYVPTVGKVIGVDYKYRQISRHGFFSRAIFVIFGIFQFKTRISSEWRIFP